MPALVPVDGTDPAFSQRVSLGGTEFLLAFEWNTRDDRWYASIYDSSGLPIRTSMKVVPRWFLFQRVVDERRPAGQLAFVDLSGSDDPILRDDLGARAKLYFYSNDELGL